MFTLIESISDLDYLNKELLSKEVLGIDTEFRRTTKENMKLCLMQINDSQETYLIDCIKIDKPGELCSFLHSDKVLKVLHSFKEDLEAISSWSNKGLSNVFDTQLANAFLGGSFSIGYQDLVQEKLDVEIEKLESRSNWLRRPLSDSQIRYAVSDVEFLLNLYLEQRIDLEKSGKRKWFNEEIKTFLCKESPFGGELKSLRNTEMSLSMKREFLDKLNEQVELIAKKNSINKTLLLSKKNQKDFLKSILDNGKDQALKEMTIWRNNLLNFTLKDLFLSFNL